MASNNSYEQGNARLTIMSRCAWCGKKFERPGYREWGWTGKYRKVYCTYGCMRADEREKGARRHG